LARSGFVWTIATLRADFLARLSELPALVRLMEGGGEYRLLPPTREELGQMIRLPALYAGLRFEERSKTRTTLDQLLRDEALKDWQRDLALSWEMVAEARRLQADLEGALDGFSHSLEIARRMVVKDPNDANWQRNLGSGYQQIGEVCQAKGNLSAAADAFAKTDPKEAAYF
jgi:tetratricopeptide (TPR) repeat protein